MKNAERYITPDLKEYEEKILTAEDRSKQLEFDLFQALRERVAAQTPRLLAIADVLAQLDVMASLAELADSRAYCKPELSDDPVLAIRHGRHPVLEQTLPPGTFVPNSVQFDAQNGRLWLITGPNMSGKSTFLRQNALIVLLAQMGSYVPAESAVIGVADKIFTRVGASDELSRGQSTFMVEMTEAANILNNATARSLVILDEIGRGTSTYDGVSLAWAITEHLHDAIRCRALFATHYHELAQLAETLSGLRNYNVLVRETEGDVIFLHQIAPGSAERSYGIHVAKLAGVPAPVLRRAEAVLAELETRHRLPGATGETPPPAIIPRRRRSRETGPGLFGDE
jgi:DNA mismatch repair protein MutS